jgi:hypothetical protein
MLSLVAQHMIRIRFVIAIPPSASTTWLLIQGLPTLGWWQPFAQPDHPAAGTKRRGEASLSCCYHSNYKTLRIRGGPKRPQYPAQYRRRAVETG